MTARALMLLPLLLASSLVSACRTSDPPRTSELPTISHACRVALAPRPQQRDIDRKIHELQERARQDLRSRSTLEQLGYEFIARARAANQPGDYALAEQTGACLESQYPDNPAALLLRGHALHQLHRFREAEALARRLVAMREFALDYGLLGDALMEQGQLARAAVAYQKMIDIRPFYQSFTRAAHLRWLRGDVDGAVDLMRKAIAAASPRNRESIAWAYTRLAGYELQRGRLTEASRATDAALTYERDYAAALLVRGRVFLAKRRPAKAIEPLWRAVKLNPVPEYQWTLADALRLLGRDAEADGVERELVARGTEADPRTLALYLATRHIHIETAIALSERELTTRADVFTQDAYGWALAAAGRAEEARTAMARALAENTRDARLFLHAGIIAASMGRNAEARNWLAKATTFQTTLLPSEIEQLSSATQAPLQRRTR